MLLLPPRLSIATQENLGNYSCVFGRDAKIDFVLAGNDHVKTGVRDENGAAGSQFDICPPCQSAPQMGELRDKPIVSYVGDTAVIACKMEESKPQPTSWIWYKANGTEKVGEPLGEAFSLGFSCQHIFLIVFFFSSYFL